MCVCVFPYHGQQHNVSETWVPLASLSITVDCLPKSSIKPRVMPIKRESRTRAYL